MKYLFSIIMLSCIVFITKGQTVSYSYDSAGNRTDRSVIQLRSESSTTATDNLSVTEDKVIVHPNPTDGYLLIELPISESYEGRVQIFSVTGKLVYNSKVNSGTIDVDIRNNPSGIYLLKVEVNGKSYSRKILKK